MSRIGTIQSIKGDFAELTTSRRGICEGCSGKASCSFDSALGKDVPENVTVFNPVNAQVGDSVEFDLTGHTELKVSLVVWVVPLIGLITGAVLGATQSFFANLSQDVNTLVGAVLGFLLAFSIVVIYDRKFTQKEKHSLQIIKILTPGNCDYHPPHLTLPKT